MIINYDGEGGIALTKKEYDAVRKDSKVLRMLEKAKDNSDKEFNRIFSDAQAKLTPQQKEFLDWASDVGIQ